MIIYKWTNTANGKIYVGQTTKSLKHRVRMHVNSSNSGTAFPLHLAIQKYGKAAFIVEQIAVAFSREQLNQLEISYIKQFDCLAPKGYNLRTGGDNLEWHPEMRHKASVSAKVRMAKDGGDIHFVVMGRRFGYPECCIIDFVTFMVAYLKGEKPVRENRKLNGTGYVPCPKCNERSEAELLAAIAIRRDPELAAFPNERPARAKKPA